MQFLQDVVYHNDGVIHNHTHTQNQSRQGYDVEGDAQQLECQQRDEQRQWDGQCHQHSQAPLTHKEQQDQQGKKGCRQKVPLQIVDRIRQQFRLVSSYVKFQIRISFLQVGNHIVHLALQLIHLCIILLDDAQGNAILPIMPDDVSAYGRMLLYLTQVLELEHPPLMVDINIAYIIHRQNLTVEMHIILVNAISHRKGRQSDVILSQGSLQLLHRDAQSRQFVRIRHTLNLGCSQSAHIHHGCGRQLLQATAHHISGKVAQLGKLCRSLLPRWFTTERDVEEKGRNIRSTRLDDLGTNHILRHISHRHVDFLIYLDEKHVDVGTRLKLQQDISHIHSRV